MISGLPKLPGGENIEGQLSSECARLPQMSSKQPAAKNQQNSLAAAGRGSYQASRSPQATKRDSSVPAGSSTVTTWSALVQVQNKNNNPVVFTRDLLLISAREVLGKAHLEAMRDCGRQLALRPVATALFTGMPGHTRALPERGGRAVALSTVWGTF